MDDVLSRFDQSAFRDPITGLPDRTDLIEFAQELLTRLESEGKKAAFLTINFDAYNELGPRYTSTGVDYLFNGQLVGTDNDPGYLSTADLGLGQGVVV